MLHHDNVAVFRKQIGGTVVEPQDSTYAESRKVYNGMIDRKPRLLVYCHDAADVVLAVAFARDNGLRASIRGGGHNAGGLGICDDGVVIELSSMNSVEVNAAEKTVRVGGGAKWAEVDAATHSFGLAVPSGIISTTGVGA